MLEDDLSSVKMARRAFDSMPSLDVAVTLKTALHRDSEHRWTTNDIQDIDARFDDPLLRHRGGQRGDGVPRPPDGPNRPTQHCRPFQDRRSAVLDGPQTPCAQQCERGDSNSHGLSATGS